MAVNKIQKLTLLISCIFEAGHVKETVLCEAHATFACVKKPNRPCATKKNIYIYIKIDCGMPHFLWSVQQKYA